MTKRHWVGLRVDDDERARIDRIARALGLGRQDAIRVVLRRYEAERLATGALP